MSVEVKEEGDEEVLVVCEESNEAAGAPVIAEVLQLEPEVPAEVRPVIANTPPVIITSTSTSAAAPSTSSNNRVRPNRRRRGARKNEKNRKSSEEESAPINRYVTKSYKLKKRPFFTYFCPFFAVMSGNTFLKRSLNQTTKVGKLLVKTEVTSWFLPCQALLKS